MWTGKLQGGGKGEGKGEEKGETHRDPCRRPSDRWWRRRGSECVDRRGGRGRWCWWSWGGALSLLRLRMRLAGFAVRFGCEVDVVLVTWNLKLRDRVWRCKDVGFVLLVLLLLRREGRLKQTSIKALEFEWREPRHEVMRGRRRARVHSSFWKILGHREKSQTGIGFLCLGSLIKRTSSQIKDKQQPLPLTIAAPNTSQHRLGAPTAQWRKRLPPTSHAPCTQPPPRPPPPHRTALTPPSTIRLPFPTPRLAHTALRALAVDEELSPLVRRAFSLGSDGADDATAPESSVLITEYRATTNRMLRVAVNGFFESVGVVLSCMRELDVEVVGDEWIGDGDEEVDGLRKVQGLEERGVIGG